MRPALWLSPALACVPLAACMAPATREALEATDGELERLRGGSDDTTTLASLEGRLAAVEQRCDDDAADDATRDGRMAELEAQLAEEQAARGALAADIGALTTELDALRDELAALGATTATSFEDLNARVDTMDGSLGAVVSELIVLDGRVTVVESALAAQGGALTAAEARIASLEADVTDLYASMGAGSGHGAWSLEPAAKTSDTGFSTVSYPNALGTAWMDVPGASLTLSGAVAGSVVLTGEVTYHYSLMSWRLVIESADGSWSDEGARVGDYFAVNGDADVMLVTELPADGDYVVTLQTAPYVTMTPSGGTTGVYVYSRSLLAWQP